MSSNCSERRLQREFPGSSVVRTGLFHCWSPGELRLCKPHGTAKRKRDRESCRKGENMLVIIRSEIATRFWRRKWQPTPVLLPGKSHGWRSLVGYTVHGIAKSQTWLSDFTFTFHFHALEKEMAAHSSVLAWRILGTEDPGGLPSMESHRVGHDWSDFAVAAATRSKEI